MDDELLLRSRYRPTRIRQFGALLMAKYGLCGRIVATSGNGEKLAGYLLDAASALQEVEGCDLYLVSLDPDDVDSVWVVEVWESAEAHQASLSLEAVQELIQQARPVIASMAERFEMSTLGGKGLR
jgi:quinol monooxygenase YgiN